MRNSMRNAQNSAVNNLITDGAKSSVQITTAGDVKRALLIRYGSLSNAAKELDVDYNQMSQVLNRRARNSYVLASIKDEFGLTDAQISALFPKPMSAREFKLAQVSA